MGEFDLVGKNQEAKGPEGRGAYITLPQGLNDEKSLSEAGLKYEDVIDWELI